MDNGLQTIIYVIIAICVILAIAVVAVLAYVWYRDNQKDKISSSKSGEKKTNKPTESQTRLQGIESMSKFLAFDDIVDSMIVRKNRTQYVMVLQCKGINFDLLGEEEKMAVESGFIQFLHTLRFPVQLYIQSRSLNLRDSIDRYEAKVNEVKDEITKLDNQIRKESSNGRLDVVRKLEFERRRKLNILEYGLDITSYVARLSQNRNVLQQNTYVAVAYYTSEFGGQISNYSKEEVDNIAFSELYTRAQTISRALASSGVTSRVMSSEELAELLYVAYNRDDSELISIRRAVEAQYDSLYNTAKDVMEKQKEMIEEKVEKEAIDLTANSITKANDILRLRQENREEIKRRAQAYVERYRGEMTDELYEETKRQIDKTDITKLRDKKSGEASARKSTSRAKIDENDDDFITEQVERDLKNAEKSRAAKQPRTEEERRLAARRLAARRLAARRAAAGEARRAAAGEARRRTRPQSQDDDLVTRRKSNKTAE